MRRRHARAAVGAASALLAAVVPPLLTRMRSEFDSTGRFATPTVAAMNVTYAIHAAAVAVAARHRLGEVPLRSSALDTIGTAIGVTGVALAAAGMRRFGFRQQLSGADHGRLATDGVYRYSRNPQYLGIVAALGGLAVARRSLVVAGLAAGYAGVVGWWVPVEESALERQFGDTYRHYRHNVARWLGARRRATVWTYETVVAASPIRAFRLLTAPDRWFAFYPLYVDWIMSTRCGPPRAARSRSRSERDWPLAYGYVTRYGAASRRSDCC